MWLQELGLLYSVRLNRRL